MKKKAGKTGGLRRPGELQLAILKVLWAKQEASVAAVHRALAGRKLAPTTIATMLRKMEDRGMVSHRKDGRQFLYFAKVSEESVHRSVLEDALETVFDGSTTAMVSHLLEEGSFDKNELGDLKALITEKEKGKAGRRRRG